MRRLRFLLVCSALVVPTSISLGRLAQDPVPPPTPEQPPASPPKLTNPPSDPKAVAPLKWPSFEPFEMARLSHRHSYDENSGDFDPATSLKQLRALIESQTKVGRLSESRAPELKHKMAWSFVPYFMIELEPLTHDLEWSTTELELASLATKHFESLKDGVKVDLSAPDTRRQGLEAIAKWFHTQVKDPIRYGELILSFDQGPYVGNAAEVPENATVVGSIRVQDAIELKLLDVEGSDRRLAAYRDGKWIWARTLTHFGSNRALNSVKFLNTRPQALGPYGYRVAMNYGENLSVYLDPEGNFLFYLQAI